MNNIIIILHKKDVRELIKGFNFDYEFLLRQKRC